MSEITLTLTFPEPTVNGKSLEDLTAELKQLDDEFRQLVTTPPATDENALASLVTRYIPLTQRILGDQVKVENKREALTALVRSQAKAQRMGELQTQGAALWKRLKALDKEIELYYGSVGSSSAVSNVLVDAARRAGVDDGVINGVITHFGKRGG